MPKLHNAWWNWLVIEICPQLTLINIFRKYGHDPMKSGRVRQRKPQLWNDTETDWVETICLPLWEQKKD